MKLFLQYFAFTFPMSVLFFHYTVKLELAWDNRQQAINRVRAAMMTVSMRRGW